MAACEQQAGVLYEYLDDLRTRAGVGMLSYEDIGSAALLSRALAGLKDGRVIFVIPGSRGAVRLAMEKLILPELGHLAGEAVKTR